MLHYITVGPSPGIRNVIIIAAMVLCDASTLDCLFDVLTVQVFLWEREKHVSPDTCAASVAPRDDELALVMRFWCVAAAEAVEPRPPRLKTHELEKTLFDFVVRGVCDCFLLGTSKRASDPCRFWLGVVGEIHFGSYYTVILGFRFERVQSSLGDAVRTFLALMLVFARPESWSVWLYFASVVFSGFVLLLRASVCVSVRSQRWLVPGFGGDCGRLTSSSLQVLRTSSLCSLLLVLLLFFRPSHLSTPDSSVCRVLGLYTCFDRLNWDTLLSLGEEVTVGCCGRSSSCSLELLSTVRADVFQRFRQLRKSLRCCEC